MVVDVAVLGTARIAPGTLVTVEPDSDGEAWEAEVTWLGGRFHQLRGGGDGARAVAPGERLALRAAVVPGIGGGAAGAGGPASAAFAGAQAVVLDLDAARHGPTRERIGELTRLARELGV